MSLLRTIVLGGCLAAASGLPFVLDHLEAQNASVQPSLAVSYDLSELQDENGLAAAALSLMSATHQYQAKQFGQNDVSGLKKREVSYLKGGNIKFTSARKAYESDMNNSLMAGLERNYKRTGANQGARRVRVEQVTVDTPVVTPAEPEASQDTWVDQLKAVVARFQS